MQPPRFSVMKNIVNEGLTYQNYIMVQVTDVKMEMSVLLELLWLSSQRSTSYVLWFYHVGLYQSRDHLFLNQLCAFEKGKRQWYSYEHKNSSISFIYNCLLVSHEHMFIRVYTILVGRNKLIDTKYASWLGVISIHVNSYHGESQMPWLNLFLRLCRSIECISHVCGKSFYSIQFHFHFL
jgi:hypothetical protein